MTKAHEILAGTEDGMAALEVALAGVHEHDYNKCVYQDWDNERTLVLLDDDSAIEVAGPSATEITGDQFREIAARGGR